MKKEEFYLYLKTLIFNFVFGTLLMIPFFIVIWFLRNMIWNIDIFSNSDLNNFTSFYLFFGIFGLIVDFILNILTAEYFYKKAIGFDLKKVTNTYLILGIILNIVFFALDFKYLNYLDYIFGFLNIVIFVFIFKNVIKNNGKFNYKKLL